MKKTILIGLLLCGFYGLSQTYEFKTVKDISCLPVISQDKTGTCWSFSTTSFLEAEILRKTGKPVNLSEMFTVRMTYLDKALNFIMRQGKANFGEGGLSHDVINSAKRYGLMPASAYTGKTNTNEIFDHAKMVAELEEYVKKAAAEPTKYATVWRNDCNAIMDKYMGTLTPEFSFNDVPYTPSTFAKSTGLQWDDYVTITSFSHEPFYGKFILNIPDNFSNGSFYNLPLDEFVSAIDYALSNGYTLALDADVSEKTFSGKTGLAVIPQNPNDIDILREIRPEMTISQEYRQEEFEKQNTTDDHLMHIVGKLTDQKGNVYYKVKNSWGADSGHNGFVYISVAYIRLKAISVMVHKDGLSKEIKSKLSL